MNPAEKACRRTVGPKCLWLVAPGNFEWCSNTKRARECGTNKPGGVGCQFYLAEPQAEKSKDGLAVGLVVGFAIGILVTLLLL